MFSLRKKRGFTLIEILLVIGIIAVLATVVIVALDPAKRFADARNARRTSDIQSILSALHQYVVDNKGAFPDKPGLNETDAEKQLGTASGGCEISGNGCALGNADCIDLSDDLAKYLKSIPYDPSVGDAEHTYYSVARNDNNIVTVRACGAEGDEEISVSR
jgi:prepilin-type N-terminal cleavage/methylation domain-containing protein